MNFLLPAGLPEDDAQELQRACLVGGPDNMPYPTQVRLDGGRLTLGRNVDESGALVVPWTVAGAGRLMCTTATLMERPTPYLLPLELARGKVNQLRNQTADWLAGGLQVAPDLLQQMRAATRTFGRAVTQLPSDQASLLAQDALALSHQAAEQLVRVYIDQMFQVRHQRQPRLDSGLGCRLGAVPASEVAAVLLRTCNSICLPLTWSDVEPSESDYHWQPADTLLDWAQAQGVTVNAGPLIDFSKARLPYWLWLWERDLHSLASFMCDYVETVVRRYRGRIGSWQLTAASNYAAGLLGLGEEEMLWLTVRLVEAARQADPGLELVVGVAQPWGEYMALEDRTHSPFVFADTLIRAGLNLSALDVEFVMGVAPRGSYCRDLLEASRLLDLYTLLGVALRVTLGYPSADAPDPAGDPELSVGLGYWHNGFSPNTQADWTAAFAALALCKPAVQAILWAHLSDAEPHQFPHCGLLDARGRIKPALERLRELRERHLR